MGELIVQIQLFIVSFKLLDPLFAAGAAIRVAKGRGGGIVFAVVEPLGYNLPVLYINGACNHAVQDMLVLKSVDIVPVALCLGIEGKRLFDVDFFKGRGRLNGFPDL